jgi:hypothetical protein
MSMFPHTQGGLACANFLDATKTDRRNRRGFIWHLPFFSISPMPYFGYMCVWGHDGLILATVSPETWIATDLTD